MKVIKMVGLKMVEKDGYMGLQVIGLRALAAQDLTLCFDMGSQ